MKNDFDYWGIDEMCLEPCCALKYYPEMEVCSKEQVNKRNKNGGDNFDIREKGRVQKRRSCD